MRTWDVLLRIRSGVVGEVMMLPKARGPLGGGVRWKVGARKYVFFWLLIIEGEYVSLFRILRSRGLVR